VRALPPDDMTDAAPTPPDAPLAGKVLLITGAGRGIGRAIALGAARAGAAVGCIARSADQVRGTAAAIEAEGGRSLALLADVTCQAEVEAAFERTAQAFGGIDLVFANAGVTQGVRVADSDPAAWWGVMTTNVFGVYLTARAAVPWLRRRGGGRIVVIGSGTRKEPAPGRSAYAASKAAAWMLVQTLALELRADGISVNELVPGPVLTDMLKGRTASLPGDEWFKQPEDVVPLALFLMTLPEPGPTAQSFSLMRRA
jgi:3-oxoacyl-[acyl-carrier protein] reductase